MEHCATLLVNIRKTCSEVASVFRGTPKYEFDIASKTSDVYPIDLLFTLDDEAKFYCPKDSSGIPQYRYATAGLQYNPTRIASYALANFARWRKTGCRIAERKFWTCASWFLRSGDGLFRYRFAWHGLEAGWVSAMAQGQGISVLGRAFRASGDEAYRQHAIKAAIPMMVPLNEGGLFSLVDGRYDFMEEWPLNAPRHTLNGFIFALIGLMDLKLVSESTFAEIPVDRFVRTLEQLLPRYDLGFWSAYDLHRAQGNHPNPATSVYHSMHIAQLTFLGEYFNNSRLMAFAVRWKDYRESIFNQAKALLWKIRYRRLEKPQR
jgi:heparosan-N-sulfate-glucuronate 5-epimerase